VTPDGRLQTELRPHRGDRLSRRRHHPESNERTTVDHDHVVDENLVFTVSAVGGVDVDTELTAEPRRHTDGMHSRESIPAVADHHSCHTHPPCSSETIAVHEEVRNRRMVRTALRPAPLSSLECGDGGGSSVLAAITTASSTTPKSRAPVVGHDFNRSVEGSHRNAIAAASADVEDSPPPRGESRVSGCSGQPADPVAN
jgi:hypothetical protein